MNKEDTKLYLRTIESFKDGSDDEVSVNLSRCFERYGEGSEDAVAIFEEFYSKYSHIEGAFPTFLPIVLQNSDTSDLRRDLSLLEQKIKEAKTSQN